MKKREIHLIIATGQPQANLIPIMQLKPDVVALAVSEAMRDNAKNFIKLLKSIAGYQDENIIRFDQVPDVGLEAIKDRAMEIEEELHNRYPGCPITYHATGGTKLMALGFYDVFHRSPNTVIYTDTNHGQIEIVYPEKHPPLPIAKVLTIESSLQSMDKRYRKRADVAWEQKARQRRALSFWLAQNAPELQQFWTVMNTLAHQALTEDVRGNEPAIKSPHQRISTAPLGAWKTALEKISAAGLCQWSPEASQEVYFDNVDGAKYLHGAWLEEYVWLTADQLRCDEVWANVQFTESGTSKEVRNEMDCLVLHNNRLLMIECKTGVFKEGDIKNAQILFKLDSLERRTAGLFGDAWLVSARSLDDDTLNRARQYKIKVISGGDLKNFKEEVQRWMEGKK